jgi:phosphatidylinositol alpha 1,6-mannosyltransferase
MYANADLFVHPNPCEPFGIAPLEAMASGLPLVAPVRGGVLEYASHENAWLTEPDGAALAAAVRAALADPVERHRRSRNARDTAGGRGWAAVTRRYFQVYDDIHARYRPQRRRESPAPEQFARFLLESSGHARVRSESSR